LAISEHSSRRDELVAQAARLFSERGYHGASMQDLAEALGLLRGSLYAHIGSKEDLLFDVANQGADRFLERGLAAAAEAGTPPERLRAFLGAHVETAIEHLDAGTVFMNEWRYLSPALRTKIQDKRDLYESTVRDLLTEGQRSGRFRADLDVALAARLVLSAGNWVYAWYRPDKELSPREIGRGYADMLIRGFEEGP